MSADNLIGQNLIIDGRLQTVTDDQLVDFYCKGYAEGYKGGCEAAAKKLIDEAHHRHVDLSDIKQVSRVAEEIREMSEQ
tara:strand:- start:374 stop:610 length:237 start_codon:yes stop_codon:yes gene_type:complete